jgi:protein-S-isoprenylcysteine O-methyltransferase Ste14
MMRNDEQSPLQTRMASSWQRVARRIRVPLGFAFAVLYLWRARPSWLSLGAGGLIAAVGLLVRAVASGHVDKNEELAISGPYAYVRNPLYLGSIIIAAGFAFAARDALVAVLIVLVFAIIYVPTIRSEEHYLRNLFTEYEAYAQRVPALFPRTLRFGGMMDGFSRALYMKHREYNALFGAVVMWAALVAKLLWFRG